MHKQNDRSIKREGASSLKIGRSREALAKPTLAIIAPLRTRNSPESSFVRFVRDNANQLREHFHIIATEGTGDSLISTGCFTDMHVERLRRGGQGGILQIAHRVIKGECGAVVFLYDPEEVRSESPETRALTRACIQKKIPFLTTSATAEYWLHHQAPNWVLRQSETPSKSASLDYPELILPHDPATKTVALIAHDGMKEDMKRFLGESQVRKHLSSFSRILATGTTGSMIRGWYHRDEIADKIVPLNSGPKGGDIEIAHEVLEGRCNVVIFFHDTLSAHPHDPDISLLRRTCQLPLISPLLFSDIQSAKMWVSSCFDESAIGADEALSGALRDKFSLKEVLIIPRDSVSEPLARIAKLQERNGGWGLKKKWEEHKVDWKIVMREVATVAARYADAFLRSRDGDKLLTVNHGSTLRLFSDALSRFQPEKIERLRICALVGNPSGIQEDDSSNKIVEAIAETYKCEPIDSTLSILGKAKDAESPKARAMRSLQLQSTVLVTNLGAIPNDERFVKEADFIEGGKASDMLVKEAMDNRALGELGGIVFGADGRDIHLSLMPLGIGLEELKTMASDPNKRVILVSGGDRRRTPVIRAALQHGICSVLATDPDTALALLEDKSPVLGLRRKSTAVDGSMKMRRFKSAKTSRR